MDTTFISIHDLTENATILYSSDSVVDVLGYTPDDIVNSSAWDFFDVADLPYARLYQQKRVALDKAAVLAYCRIRNSRGVWIGCECCFTIVYDVMVVCTSVYKHGIKSQKRAEEAPMVRRMFSSSPKDPRYHMLSHISAKFMASTAMAEHEPRAALFLNRFTRTLTIMYATSGLEEVIGIPASEMRGRSFYYCIAESCLQDAVKCLENAKGNDSIAYLRFWFRDPRIDDETESSEMSDEEMTSDGSDTELLQPTQPRAPVLQRAPDSTSANSGTTDSDASKAGSSSYSTDAPSSHGMVDSPYFPAGQSPERVRQGEQGEQIELEAVISCTSDGLVVCLRRARALMPFATATASQQYGASTGTFAAPWATEPIIPTRRSASSQDIDPSRTDGSSAASSTPAPPEAYLTAIQEQAIFAWALAGINGTLTDFSIGKPHDEAYPSDGSPVWTNDPAASTKGGTEQWQQSASSDTATVKASDHSALDGGAGSFAFSDSESEYLNRDLSEADMRDRKRNPS